MSKSDRAAWASSLGLLLAALISLVVVAYARGAVVTRLPAKRQAPSSDPAPAAAAPPEVVWAERVPLWLPFFYRELQALQLRGAERPVRILWLGGSHTVGDFWTHAARAELQERFGDGGPGLLSIGLRERRHGAVTAQQSGPWKRIPASPAAPAPRAAGPLGLLGMGAVALSRDCTARLQLASPGGGRSVRVRWELLFRLPSEGASFRVAIGEQEPALVTLDNSLERPSGLRSFVGYGNESPVLSVGSFEEQPELFGAIAEVEPPGVVLDTLGIDDARVATALSWDAAAWSAELRSRRPALVVMAYGANELDRARLVEHRDQYAALLARVRAAAPQADCLVVGPPDRAGEDGREELPMVEIDAVQRALARRAGCAYFSALRAMGGEGGFAEWARRDPPLASGDGVHLSAAGYRRLGGELAGQMIESYELRFPRGARLE